MAGSFGVSRVAKCPPPEISPDEITPVPSPPHVQPPPLSIPRGWGGTVTSSTQKKSRIVVDMCCALPHCHCCPSTVHIVTGRCCRFLWNSVLVYVDSAVPPPPLGGNRHLATVPPGVGGDRRAPGGYWTKGGEGTKMYPLRLHLFVGWASTSLARKVRPRLGDVRGTCPVGGTVTHHARAQHCSNAVMAGLCWAAARIHVFGSLSPTLYPQGTGCCLPVFSAWDAPEGLPTNRRRLIANCRVVTANCCQLTTNRQRGCASHCRRLGNAVGDWTGCRRVSL